MIGVSDPDGTLRAGEVVDEDSTTWFSSLSGAFGLIGLSLGSFLALAGVCFLVFYVCLLYTSPSPRDRQKSRMPSSA